MQTQGLHDYRNYRYFKLALLLAALASLGYWLARPDGGLAYGGTWFGYLLGITSAVLVLLHAWYGIRKRRLPLQRNRRQGERRRIFAGRGPDTRRGSSASLPADSLQGWLSAHIYLGFTLFITATLHTGFRLGWNLHSLTYVLLLLVMASGLYGAYAYLHYPRQISLDTGNQNIDMLLEKISALDVQARERVAGLPDEVAALVDRACRETRIGGSLLERLKVRQLQCPTEAAAIGVRALGKQLLEGDQPRRLRDLYAVLLRKQRLVSLARSTVGYDTRMKLWLYVHTPLAIALIATLIAHVASILIYW